MEVRREEGLYCTNRGVYHNRRLFLKVKEGQQTVEIRRLNSRSKLDAFMSLLNET
jgi:hypothetical protein